MSRECQKKISFFYPSISYPTQQRLYYERSSVSHIRRARERRFYNLHHYHLFFFLKRQFFSTSSAFICLKYPFFLLPVTKVGFPIITFCLATTATSYLEGSCPTNTVAVTARPPGVGARTSGWPGCCCCWTCQRRRCRSSRPPTRP